MVVPNYGEIRALTIRQPWCQAVADGVKMTENRAEGFPKNYRGLLLIHSAVAFSAAGFTDLRMTQYRDESNARLGDPTVLPIARVLAVCDVVDIHPASGCCAPWGEETYAPNNPEDRPPGRVTHLTFEGMVKLPKPVGARGGLGLWRPDDDLVIEVCHQLAELITWDSTNAAELADKGGIGPLYWAAVAEPSPYSTGALPW